MTAQDKHGQRAPSGLRFRSSLRRLGARLGWGKPLLLPHFLVLGTQKGGTTSLHHLLGRHPEIYLPEVKEVHYFSQHFHQPLSWYADHYAQAQGWQRRGDITPFYLFHLEVPERIKAILPKALLIALLRDPVERTLSQYFHACRNGYEELGLEAALEAEASRLEGAETVVSDPKSQHYSYQKHSYLSRSRYEQQLQRYQTCFKDKQLLLLRSEDLFAKPDTVWSQIIDFLGVEPIELPGDLPRFNAGRGEAQAVPASLRAQLRDALAPTYRYMESQHGITWPAT